MAPIRDEPHTDAAWPPPTPKKLLEVETDEVVVGLAAREEGAVTDPNPEVTPGAPVEVVLAPNTELLAAEEVNAVGAAEELWLETGLATVPSALWFLLDV